MFLQMAVGDSYGIAWEFIDKADCAAVGPNDLSAYHRHPKYSDLGGGRYTDDTQRALANARVLLGAASYDPERYALEYVDTFKLDPRPGYSKRMYELLQSCANARQFLAEIDPSGLTNGAVMGAAPLGYLPHVWQVRMAAYAQASVTHAPETFRFAFATALMAHYFLHEDSDRSELPHYLNWHVGGLDWCEAAKYDGAVDMSAENTTKTVLNLVTTHESLAEMLRAAVDRGGDTDTTAALSMAVGSCCCEIADDLPAHLITGLAETSYGAQHLKGTEFALNRRFLPSE